MNVKYQIFVSSTYEDLRDERAEVIKACLSMGHIPVGMEMFNAADEEQWAIITRTIDQCDYYVVIIAHRYGSTTPEGISFTEKEYNYAVSRTVPVLGFIIGEDAPWPNQWVDKDQTAVHRLKLKVRKKMVKFWRNKSELQAYFSAALVQTISLNPHRGWIRAPQATDVDLAQSPSALAESAASTEEATRGQPGITPEMDFSAARLVDILATWSWSAGNRKMTCQPIFINLCEVLGSTADNAYNIAMKLDVDHFRMSNLLNRLELLGALGRDRYGAYVISDIGRQMYKKLMLDL